MTNIIHKQILAHNDTNILPVYYNGQLGNGSQIVAHKLMRRALSVAHTIDDAIASTWQK